MVQIQGYKVNKLHMENTVANGTELQLQNQVKYNVNYMDDVHKCVGILSFRITDGNMNPFEVQIDMVAEFTYDEGDDKADIHTQSFDQIYPFLRQIVNQMAATAACRADDPHYATEQRHRNRWRPGPVAPELIWTDCVRTAGTLCATARARTLKRASAT